MFSLGFGVMVSLLKSIVSLTTLF